MNKTTQGSRPRATLVWVLRGATILRMVAAVPLVAMRGRLKLAANIRVRRGQVQ